MVLRIDKRWDSGRASQEWLGNGGSVDHTFFVFDDAGREDIDEEVYNWLDPEKVGNLPTSYLGKYWLQRWNVEYQGGSLWYVPATYTYADPRAITWTGDTTGGTQHVTQSRETVVRRVSPSLVPSGLVPDFKGAIGVNGETVAGCDVVVPALHLTAVRSFERSEFTVEFEDLLFGMTGTVNSAQFRQRKKGELLFLGATWTKRADLPTVECTFKFAGSMEVQYGTAETLDGNAGYILSDFGEFKKEGWHYLWIRYRRRDNAGVTQLPAPPGPPPVPGVARFDVYQPEAVYVERVYRYSNFLFLRLGDGNDPPVPPP